MITANEPAWWFLAFLVAVVIIIAFILTHEADAKSIKKQHAYCGDCGKVMVQYARNSGTSIIIVWGCSYASKFTRAEAMEHDLYILATETLYDTRTGTPRR